MKIAYLCADRGIPVLGNKGASVHVREMISAFVRTGHTVSLFCTQLGDGNPAPPGECIELPIADDPDLLEFLIKELGLGTEPLEKPLRRELQRLAHDRTLSLRILERLNYRPDLLYERYSLMHRTGIDIARALEVPHLLEINAPLVEEEARFRSLVQRDLAERIEQELFQNCSHIIAVSEAMKTHAMSKGVPETKISVLRNGVDNVRFNTTLDRLQIRARHGLSDGQIIGFVGSLKPWHGIDLLVDAFQLVRRVHKDARLLIVGDGPMMASLSKRVVLERLGRSVVLTGHVPHNEIPSYLAAMDITVAPYQPQENFYFSPMKVIESMAVGRPVVAPRIGQLKELIEDGITGRLYEPGNTEACASAISDLLFHPLACRAIGEQAANKARLAFNWDSNANRIAALSASLADQLIAPSLPLSAT